jgi:hypothetical protein
VPEAFAGSGRPISQADFSAACGKLGVDDASLWAILTVETKGFGYLTDRRPKILFERHIFSARTNHAFDASHPDISGPRGGYIGGPAEYDRLNRAIALNRRAALESASWGLAQIMGFNAATIGYADAEAMVASFVQSEAGQLDGCVRFLMSNDSLHNALKAKIWDRVAFHYNGASYADNAYDKKLAQNYTLFASGQAPAIGLRAAQARLSYLGYDPHGIDGVMGPGTRGALTQFQTAQKLPVTGELDAATASLLESLANC